MSKYIDEFLSLRSAPDILAATGHFNARGSKEITEAMAIIARVRKLMHMRPIPTTIVDLCSGNALVPLIATHLFDVQAMAIDKRYPRSHYIARKDSLDKFTAPNVARYLYLVCDVTSAKFRQQDASLWDRITIVTAVHPCQRALHICQLFISSRARALVLMPCCEGGCQYKKSQYLVDKLGTYGCWCLHLYNILAASPGMTVRMAEDRHVLSPKNVVITAERE